MAKPMTAFEEQYPKALQKIERLEAVVEAALDVRDLYWANASDSIMKNAQVRLDKALAAHDKEGE